MRVSQFGFLALVLPALSGCGTVHNLKASPDGCHLFGGVVSSGFLGVMAPSLGLNEINKGNIAIWRGEFGHGFEQIGQGVLGISVGLILIVDTPLSLAGDIVTLPVAYARSNEYPWATWWGEKSIHNPLNPPATTPEEGGKKTDAGIERVD